MVEVISPNAQYLVNKYSTRPLKLSLFRAECTDLKRISPWGRAEGVGEEKPYGQPVPTRVYFDVALKNGEANTR